MTSTKLLLIALISSAIALLGGSNVRAQTEGDEPTTKDLLERIELLELEIGDLKQTPVSQSRRTEPDRTTDSAGSTSMGASPGLMGNLGQTTRFSRTFNPSLGAAVDVIGNRQTGSDSGEHQDRFWLRAAELNLAAQIDPFGYAYVIVEAGEGESVSIIEAAAVMNRLPANFSVKGGKILADFGKFGQRHDHELPFVEKPLVYYDYIGGSINSTGLEIHQWFGITDEIPLRWSAGVYNELEGHGHRVWGGHHHGHDHGAEPFGKRQIDNFAYNGRVTGYGDLTDNSSLQVGASCLWAPEIQAFHQEAAGDPVERWETRRTVAGADVTYKWTDPASRREFIFGVEGFKSRGTFLHEEEEEIEDGDACGGYAWCEYAWSPYWAAGVMGGAFESAMHDNVGQREISTWLTWKISHYNWLRAQYRFNDLERHGDAFAGEDFSEFFVQWIFVFGSHAHGLNW